jgi:hypothetical protein
MKTSKTTTKLTKSEKPVIYEAVEDCFYGGLSRESCDGFEVIYGKLQLVGGNWRILGEGKVLGDVLRNCGNAAVWLICSEK